MPDIRPARHDEFGALADIFFRAVRDSPGPYSPEQRRAWAGRAPQPGGWPARLEGLDVLVAEVSGRVAGFLARAENGYVDLAFVLPDYQRQGVFRALLARSEARARADGEPRLWAHASLMAEPAFRAAGFRVIQHETVTIAGQELHRSEMEKYLR